MTDILEALALLADSNIVHRDVKPENVMLSSSKRARQLLPATAPPLTPHEQVMLDAGVAKLGDFGQARIVGGSMSPYVATRW